MSQPSIIKRSILTGVLIAIGALFSMETKPYEPKAKAVMP